MGVISKDRFRFPPWCKTPSNDFVTCKTCGIKDNCELQIHHQLLEACKGFYYTYKLLLEETRHPIFTHSQEELEEKINRNSDKWDQPQLFYVILTNGALAAELAIKFLTFQQKHNFIEDHKLDVLFNDLPPKDQNEILSRIKQQTGIDRKLFREMLKNFSDAFVKARYFFAQEENGISNLFDDFVRIVCEYAVEVYERKLKEGLEADVAFGGN